MFIDMLNRHLHVMFGVTFFGLIIANYFYVTYSFRLGQHKLINYALKTSLWLDILMGFIILFMFMSAAFLVKQHNLSIHTPWILTAYIAFSCISLIWIAVIFIKFYYYKRPEKLILAKSFHALNIAMIILLMIIVHDAVMHKTFFVFN